MREKTLGAMDAWLAEIANASKRNESVPGLTVVQLAEKTHCSENTARVRMRQLVMAGKAKHAGFRTGTSMSGQGTRVPVYSLVRGKK